MMVELEIKRLDQAAQACDVPYYTDRSRVVMTVLALFAIVIAIVAGSSSIESNVVRVAAFFLCLSVLGLWLRWKYAAFTLAVLYSGLAIGIVAFRGRPHDIAGIMINLLLFASLASQAYVEWIRSIRFVRVQAQSWSGERTQVQEWLDQIESPNEPARILQFASGSFWTGYFTYRLLNTGLCWVIARYKTGALDRALEHRVLPLDGVRITELPEGGIGLELNGRAVSNVKPLPRTPNGSIHSVEAGW
jgi:hypothetical protein